MCNFRKKKNLHTDFEPKRNLTKKHPPHNGFVCQGKKLYQEALLLVTGLLPEATRGLGEKKLLHKSNHHLIYAAMEYVTSFHGDTGPPASESGEARLCCHIG